MPAAIKPENEAARLQSLKQLNVLDSKPEEEFDALVKAAALVCDVPIALISLVDSDRQWFKANVGLPGVTETPRELAFCAHAIHQDATLEVCDATKDHRFSDNPLVINDPKIRFYAGSPLTLSDGAKVGTFCVIDQKPRRLNAKQREILENLAIAAVAALEGRRAQENEKKVAAEAKQLGTMLQNSLDAIVSISLDEVVTHANQAAATLFGYASVDLEGVALNRLMSRTERNENEPITSLLKKHPKGLHYEAECIHKSGRVVPVSVSLSPIYDQHDRLAGATKILRDISERIAAETLLAEKEARFRALSEVSPLGVFSTDAVGACIYTNARWQSIFGLSYEESLGQGWKKAVHPLDLEQMESEWQKTARQSGEFDMEFRVLSQRGGVNYVRSRARPLLGEQGEVTGFIGTTEDVTQLHGTLKRLSHSEERIRDLYQTTPAMLQSLDGEGRILSVSNQWLEKHEYSREEVIGRYATDFMVPESAQYARNDVMPAIIEHGFVNNVLYKKVTKSGKLFDVSLSSVLEYDNDGKLARAKCVLIDVTAENLAKRAADELLGTISSQFIVSVTDLKGRIIEANDAFCSISQYEKDELLGKTHRLVNSGVHDKSFFKEMWKTIAAGKAWRGEICNLAKDGTYYWVDSVISPLRDVSGAVTRYISIRTDITERKAAENAVFEQKQKVQQVLENQSVATFIIDAKHEVTHWNYACEKLTGVSAKSIIGSKESWRGFYDEARPCLADLVLDREKDQADQFYENQGPSKLLKPGWHAEAWFENLGGKRRYVIFDAAPITDADGNIVAVVETLQDVTDAKLVEQSLAHEKQNLDAVIEGTNAGVWQCNLSTSELQFNAQWAAMLGYKPNKVGEPLLATWHALIHPEDLDTFNQLKEQHLSGKTEIFEVEIRMQHRRGNWVWVSIRGRVMTKTADGEPEWMYGTNMDVTERKQVDLELRQAYANLEEFTAIASHDLKSPLRGIADLMEWIEEDLGEDIPEEVKNNLQRVHLRVKRMGMLINDLLAYSRAGVVEDEGKMVNPKDMLEEVIELQHIPDTFSVAVSCKVKAFKTNETPLKTILRNLISNAIKHHDKPSGKIDVNVHLKNNFYIFEVQDDGPGISDFVKDRVFKLFQTASKNNESSGVGLAVSKRMAEVHGGHLELESEVDKRVTIFRLFWPKTPHRKIHTEK